MNPLQSVREGRAARVRPAWWLVLGVLVLLAGAVALVAWLNLRGERGVHAYAQGHAGAGQARSAQETAQLVERGAYLARVGSCVGCHTAAGGAQYAGGRALQTSFGTLYAGNLTPDDDTGLGRWSAQDFWRALHNGRSRDGRLLYPAFPYDSYTRVSRDDSDALFAYLQSLAPVRQQAPEHALGFPYRLQGALAVWRALFFSPQSWQDAPQRSADWNRGAYLANGLGHCAACHAPRNALGAADPVMSGGLVAGQAWYAPSLIDPDQAGVHAGREQEWVRMLATGASASGTALGPMVEVVVRSTQYWREQDLQALAVYLRDEGLDRGAGARQAGAGAGSGAMARAGAPVLALGQKLYEQQCAVCHGAQGQGVAGAFPALAGNASVRMREPRNLLLAVLEGGYGAATRERPQPHGMPPFGHVLSDAQVAAVASYVRAAWGNGAPEVGTMEVYRAREGRGF